MSVLGRAALSFLLVAATASSGLGQPASGLKGMSRVPPPTPNEAGEKKQVDTASAAGASGAGKNIGMNEVASEVQARINANTEALIGAGVYPDVIRMTVVVVGQIAATAREDHESVYLFARQLNRNIDSCRDCESDSGSESLKTKIHNITDKLLKSSYSDDLFQNKNLSRQIRARMPLLLEDSLRLNNCVAPEEAAAAERIARKRLTDTDAAGKSQETSAAKTNETVPGQASKNVVQVTGKTDKEVSADAASTKEVNLGKCSPARPEDAAYYARAAQQRRDDFFKDVKQLSDRYLDSKRFRLGVGLSYAYLPRVHYQGSTSFDFTPYQTQVANANQTSIGNISSTRLQYERRFSGASYPGVLVSAKIPYARIDTTISKLERTQTFSPPLRRIGIDPSTDVLLRQTVTSKLSLDYDISAKVQVVELSQRWLKRAMPSRVDVGLGAGLSGFRVDDSIVNELKIAQPDKSFSDLPAKGVVNSSNNNSFNVPFWTADFTLKISDEWHMILSGKSYNCRRATDQNSLTVSGATVSMSVLWFF